MSATTDVFEKGKYDTAAFTVPESKTGNASPPVDVFIVVPTTEMTYPVLLFCHGLNIVNESYSDMLDHIASHGYVVVAPQFYAVTWWGPGISVAEEVRKANVVTEWLSTGLLAALQENGFNNVYPDVENNLVASGHNRGGKIAFALALGETGDNKIRYIKRLLFKKKTSPWEVKESSLPQKFRAVIGIDPVAGQSVNKRDNPKILHYIPRSFNMSIPVAVVGTGKTDDKGKMVFAPAGVNHAEFFNESKPPVCYFLARDYGHVDMMDENIRRGMENGIKGTTDLMRKATGGITVAFLRAYVGEEKEEKDLDAIVDDPSIAPVLLDPAFHVKE